MEDVKSWLTNNYGNGSGNGYGSGSGDGYSNGSGGGSGFSSGCIDGSGDGSGFSIIHGTGFGNGNGTGFGNGSGSGNGYSNGSGDGNSNGSGIKSFNGMDVYHIDGIQTIITHIKESFANGYVLNPDFTLTRCVIAKGSGYFAHGKTLKEARKSLEKKIFNNMDAEEIFNEFLKKFKKGKKYLGSEFFEWHHYLTGSCLMGRESFVKNHGLNLDETFTVEEFIKICENDFGGQIIKLLKERWKLNE